MNNFQNRNPHQPRRFNNNPPFGRMNGDNSSCEQERESNAPWQWSTLNTNKVKTISWSFTWRLLEKLPILFEGITQNKNPLMFEFLDSIQTLAKEAKENNHEFESLAGDSFVISRAGSRYTVLFTKDFLNVLVNTFDNIKLPDASLVTLFSRMQSTKSEIELYERYNSIDKPNQGFANVEAINKDIPRDIGSRGGQGYYEHG